MLANDERRGPSGIIPRVRITGIVRAALVFWILVRVTFFTALWLAVLLFAYLGYFTFSFLFFLAALALVSTISGLSWVRRVRAWLTGR